MIWRLSHRADPQAAVIADRHYNRQHVGSPQFVPPGRCLVLHAPGAIWVPSWPFAQYTKHRWAGAWVNSCFRKESGDTKASKMIREAVAATRWYWDDVPTLGMITFVNPKFVREKKDIGFCYLWAGFKPCGETAGGLPAFQLLPEDMPEPCAPIGAQESLLLCS